MSNHPQPDHQRPDREPDPTAPLPSSSDAPRPDGTGDAAPDPGSAPGPSGAPISAQPWPTPSGDALSPTPEPYQPPAPSYAPGYASLPQNRPPQAPPDDPPTRMDPDYPPTAQFPPVGPVNYAPPGQAPDYGPASDHGPAPSYPPPGYPPPGYQQPGFQQPGFQQPGFQQPGFQQPGYPPPQAHPGRPPRRSNAPLIAVILAVTLLLCGGIATAGLLIGRSVTEKAKEAIPDLPTVKPELPNLPTELPTQPTDNGDPGSGGGHTIEVTYEVTGDGPAEILYIDKLSGSPTRLDDVDLPWRFTTEAETPLLLSVIAMRADTTDGTISCRALIDGEEVKQRTSTNGAFATATCTHFAFE